MSSPSTAASTSGLLGQILRFVLVGGSNTLLTLVLFVLFQQWLSAPVAYTLVFALGIAYTTALTARFVFGRPASRRRLTGYVLWYLAVYGVGLIVVRLVDHRDHLPAAAIALVTVAVTAPLNFLGGRLLFHQPRAP